MDKPRGYSPPSSRASGIGTHWLAISLLSLGILASVAGGFVPLKRCPLCDPMVQELRSRRIDPVDAVRTGYAVKCPICEDHRRISMIRLWTWNLNAPPR